MLTATPCVVVASSLFATAEGKPWAQVELHWVVATRAVIKMEMTFMVG
jgi:hypothetical protein